MQPRPPSITEYQLHEIMVYTLKMKIYMASSAMKTTCVSFARTHVLQYACTSDIHLVVTLNLEHSKPYELLHHRMSLQGTSYSNHTICDHTSEVLTFPAIQGFNTVLIGITKVPIQGDRYTYIAIRR